MMKVIRHLIKRIDRRLEDKDPNTALIAMAIVANALMTIVKMIFGIYLSSGWLVINAMYFLVIGVVRYYVMKRYIFSKSVVDRKEKYHFDFNVHKIGGALVFFIGSTYSLTCVRMYIVGDAITINGMLVYFFVLFNVIKLAFAIYGMIITRNKENYIIRTMKVIGIIDAFLSIAETAYAVMSNLGYEYAAQASSIIGMVASVGVLVSGLVMLNRQKNLRVLERL